MQPVRRSHTCGGVLVESKPFVRRSRFDSHSSRHVGTLGEFLTRFQSCVKTGAFYLCANLFHITDIHGRTRGLRFGRTKYHFADIFEKNFRMTAIMSSVYNVFPNYWGTCVWTVTPPQTLGDRSPSLRPCIYLFHIHT